MRIRRRPPGQPLAYLLPSDPSAALQPPRDHRERTPPPPGDSPKQGEEGDDLHLHPGPTNDSAADLGDAHRSSSSSSPLSRPALPPPQDGAVERGQGGQQQQQLQQGPADGDRSSLENGLQRHVPEPVMIQAGERPSNNDVGAATATTGAKATKKKQQQEETKKDTSGGGGVKRAPRGPAGVLVEGSRCSRKNGRGWRCSQPTQVGYALCQYHLGKGRMKKESAAAGGRGPGQLGRTEHAKKTAAAAAAVAPDTAAAPKADVPPPPSVQHC